MNIKDKIKSYCKKVTIKMKINSRNIERDNKRSRLDTHLKNVLNNYALKSTYWSARELAEYGNVDRLIQYFLTKSPMASKIGFIGKVDYYDSNFTTTLTIFDKGYIKDFNRIMGVSIVLSAELKIIDSETDWDKYHCQRIHSPIRGYDQRERIEILSKQISKYTRDIADIRTTMRYDNMKPYYMDILRVLEAKKAECIAYHNSKKGIIVNNSTREEVKEQY